MQSGSATRTELQRHGIPVVQHLPGWSKPSGPSWFLLCLEYQQPLPPRNNGGEATFFWKSDPNLDTPDLQASQAEFHWRVLRRRRDSICLSSADMGAVCGAAEKPGPYRSDRPRPERPGADRGQYVVSPR